MPKILSLDELSMQVSQWRASGLKVGFTCGAFDLLHAGHADYLQRARSLCDRLIVAVNSDDSIRLYKDPRRPIVSETHRMQLIAALACTDAVTLMQDLRPARFIEILKPDLYIKGGDYDVSQLRSAPLVESYGGRCAVIPVEHEISTSALIARVEQFLMHAKPKQEPSHQKVKLVLLDRDGTLIEDVPFNNDPARVKLLPGVAEGLRSLQDHGFTLVIVTNQQGIGLGYFSYDRFVAVNSAMLKQLSESGVRIARIYYCPHSFADACECRKPGAKLLSDALAYFGANAEDCFMIGDSLSDVLAAKKVGCHGILVGSGTKNAENVLTKANFQDAVQFIIGKRQGNALSGATSNLSEAGIGK